MGESITRAMRVQDILALLPNAEPLLAQYGLHCVGCSGSAFETLEEGYMSHGFKEDQLDALITDLNELMKRTPPRPQTLEVTESAARELANILEAEQQTDQILVVGLDGTGNFCLEMFPDVAADHLLFGHASVPSLKLAASPHTLKRIGGATIDHRDGRFKLDVPGATKKEGCGCGGEGCSCKTAAGNGGC